MKLGQKVNKNGIITQYGWVRSNAVSEFKIQQTPHCKPTIGQFKKLIFKRKEKKKKKISTERLAEGAEEMEFIFLRLRSGPVLTLHECDSLISSGLGHVSTPKLRLSYGRENPQTKPGLLLEKERANSESSTEVLGDMHISSVTLLSTKPKPKSLREKAYLLSIPCLASLPTLEESPAAGWDSYTCSLRRSCLASAGLNALSVAMKNERIGLAFWSLSLTLFWVFFYLFKNV